MRSHRYVKCGGWPFQRARRMASLGAQVLALITDRQPTSLPPTFYITLSLTHTTTHSYDTRPSLNPGSHKFTHPPQSWLSSASTRNLPISVGMCAPLAPLPLHSSCRPSTGQDVARTGSYDSDQNQAVSACVYYNATQLHRPPTL